LEVAIRETREAAGRRPSKTRLARDPCLGR
jgi:hypothetical protein